MMRIVLIFVIVSLAWEPDPLPAQFFGGTKELLGHAAVLNDLAPPSPTVTIPSGWFLMGSPKKGKGLDAPYDRSETPQRRIWLDSYTIDRDEVSVGNYLGWLAKKPRALPPDLAEAEALSELGRFTEELLRPGVADRVLAVLPVYRVAWSEAAAYCEAHEKRLPTEAEWERAARGPTGQLFPWGNTPPSERRAVYDRLPNGKIPPTVAVGGYPDGVSSSGLHHMAGNVAEWVQDWFNPDGYQSMPDRNPKGPGTGKYRVVRGGSWKDAPRLLRAPTRAYAPLVQRSTIIGFRCAQSAPLPTRR